MEPSWGVNQISICWNPPDLKDSSALYYNTLRLLKRKVGIIKNLKNLYRIAG